VAGKATEAVQRAAETKADLDAALDEDAPGGLLGKLKARLDDRLESTVTGKVAAFIAEKSGWSMPALLGAGGGVVGLLAVVLVLLVRKDIKDKVETGDPLLIEKIAARTRNQIDDRLAGFVGSRVEAHADRDHGWREEMADIKGMLSGLREKISSTGVQK
jgi:hypothetical protein